MKRLITALLVFALVVTPTISEAGVRKLLLGLALIGGGTYLAVDGFSTVVVVDRKWKTVKIDKEENERKLVDEGDRPTEVIDEEWDEEVVTTWSEEVIEQWSEEVIADEWYETVVDQEWDEDISDPQLDISDWELTAFYYLVPGGGGDGYWRCYAKGEVMNTGNVPLSNAKLHYYLGDDAGYRDLNPYLEVGSGDSWASQNFQAYTEPNPCWIEASYGWTPLIEHFITYKEEYFCTYETVHYETREIVHYETHETTHHVTYETEHWEEWEVTQNVTYKTVNHTSYKKKRKDVAEGVVGVAAVGYGTYLVIDYFVDLKRLRDRVGLDIKVVRPQPDTTYLLCSKTF